MGWLSRLRLRAPAAAEQAKELDTLYRIILGKAPGSRDVAGLIAAYRQVPQFRSVVSKIADHVASVHWRLYSVRGKGGKSRYVRTGQIQDKAKRDKELARHKQEGNLEELHDHPMAMLFDNANQQHSGFDARRVTQIHLDVVGEAFWHLERGLFDAPVAVWPIPPHWIRQTPTVAKPVFEIRVDGKTYMAPREDVIWFRDLDPLDPYGRGVGIGEALGDEIDTSDYAAKYLKAFFFNRTKPDMLIGVSNSTEAEVKRLGEAFREKNLGYSRAHRTFWHSGELTVHELNAKFDDLQIVQLQGAVRDTFVHTYGVPPEVLGILMNSNRATVTEALRMFARETIVPRCERMRMRLQQRLVPMYDERLIVEYDSPIPDDDLFELDALKSAPYMATRGEWRKMQGLPDRGDIDNIHYVPVGLLAYSPDEAPESLGSMSLAARRGVTKDAAQGKVDAVLESLRPERMKEEMYPIQRSHVQAWGDEVLEDMGLVVNFDLVNPLTQRYFDTWEKNRITKINKTTREALNKTLLEGVRAGEGVRDLAKRVTDTFSAAEGYRAERIARTEVLSASNHATWAAHKQSGIVQQRQWISTMDMSTRDEHMGLHLDIVDLDAPFEIDGYSAMYPGGFGYPEMDINCRCTTVAVIGEPKSAKECGELWKVYDSRLIPWERVLKKAAQRAFVAQRRSINAAVRRVFG